MKRILMTGNDGIGKGAVDAGCDCYFGYPITPQNELTAYMSLHMPMNDRVFIQAESEIAAVNMVYGASAAGKRTMTSSSSPGLSLKLEGISYMAGSELPAVIVNVQRGGPGLGNIAPSQADYFQAVKGGGHGDYNSIVLAPNSVQEMYDLTVLAFDLADKYRMPVMVLSDGRIGQMMEPMTVKENYKPTLIDKPWALNGCKGRKPNKVWSLKLGDGELEEHNIKLQAKYKEIKNQEVLFDEYMIDDCDTLLVAYGTSARIARGAIDIARKKGQKVGLLRPITLWPFPKDKIEELSTKVNKIITIEMSAGQMLEDVQLAVKGQCPVEFVGRMGGAIPTEQSIIEKI
ncbi:MAG: 3-methyl-2-oxobutanoate dehydrogenase subunit VorB [Kiritimatiellae bacterium]|jgi:2-oxoglutarate ferredoxin oxidoreductase subunit alpha|nr:3-methyl-2-oxobutanoate dehydrogenase subunit VorB [Kiritimatiellia bacterium]